MTTVMDRNRDAAPADPEEVERFAGEMFGAALEAVEIADVASGLRLGPHEAPAGGPSTPADLAGRAGVGRRHARERLEEQAAAVHAVTQRLRSGYERQDAVGMGELYADDATWELLVGDARVLLHGRSSIAARYAQDLQQPPTMLRWDVRPAPWGAVVEAEAGQGEGASRVHFRWVHLLTIEQGRITGDVVHCTGALPAPAAG